MYVQKVRTAKDVVIKISKKPYFRTSFDSHHAKGSQTLLKSTRWDFYCIFFINLTEITDCEQRG